MKYDIVYTKSFKKGYKKALKRGYDLNLIDEVIEKLASGIELDAKYLDHALIGNRAGTRECHIQNDWLLIYKIDDGVLILTLIDTGTHSDLF